MGPLATGRDIALIILCLEAIVLGLIPLALAYLAVRGMRRLLPAARGWLSTLQLWVWEGQHWVTVAMHWLLAPILFLSGLRAGVQRGVAVMRRR